MKKKGFDMSGNRFLIFRKNGIWYLTLTKEERYKFIASSNSLVLLLDAANKAGLLDKFPRYCPPVSEKYTLTYPIIKD